MIGLQDNSTTNSTEHKQIRIAHVFNHSYFLGGGEISFFELIRTIDKKLFKPNAIVPAPGEIKEKLKYNNIEVHSIFFPSLRRIIQFNIKI